MAKNITEESIKQEKKIKCVAITSESWGFDL